MNVRPLARASPGADAHDLVLDTRDTATETVTPGDETEPGSGGSPPATGVVSPAHVLAAVFRLAEGAAAVPCSTAGERREVCVP